MKLINVEYTIKVQISNRPIIEASGELVTDAELVLVECESKDVKNAKRCTLLRKDGSTLDIYDHTIHFDPEITPNAKFFKPILISQNERIDVDDWIYSDDIDGKAGVGKLLRIDEFGNYIFQSPFGDEQPIDIDEVFNRYHFYKVLALPEHFSFEQLKDIVDGKLKEGKCLVECENVNTTSKEEYSTGKPLDYINVIKLNPYITLHKVEEKLYTREEMIENAFNFYYDMSNQFNVPFNLISENLDNAKEWFNKNVI